MDTCSIETGLLRKKPCGHAAVARCVNCEQPLCSQHAIPQMTEAGKRSGKFICQQCVAAAKDHDKSVAAAGRAQQEKKLAAMHKAAVEAANAPPPAPKKPAAPAPAPAAGAAELPKPEDKPIDFTPKDGKFEYTRKPEDKGTDFKDD